MNKWFAGCDNVKLFELHKKNKNVSFIEPRKMSLVPNSIFYYGLFTGTLERGLRDHAIWNPICPPESLLGYALAKGLTEYPSV